MLRAVVVAVVFFVSVSFAAGKNDHSGPNSSESTSEKPVNSPKESIDYKARLLDGLRRLPDPVVIGLSQKMGQLASSGQALNAAQLAKLIDGFEFNPNQKAELKKTFGETFSQLGSEGPATFSQAVNEVVKERNLNPTAPGPQPSQTAESSKKKELDERLAELRDLKDAIRERKRREDRDDRRRERGDRDGSQRGEDRSAQNATPQSQGSENEASKEPEPQHNRNQRNDRRDFTRPFPGFSSSNNDKKDDLSRLGESSRSKKQSLSEPSGEKKPEPSQTPEQPEAAAAQNPQSINVGMMGERSTPGSISFGGSPSSLGFSDLLANAGGALAGAAAGAKSGFSGGGGEDAVSGMRFSPDVGEPEPGGQIGGSFAGGVNYISGSDPDSDEGTGGTDFPEYNVAKPEKANSQILTYQDLSVRGVSAEEPGIFRFRKVMQQRACRRINC